VESDERHVENFCRSNEPFLRKHEIAVIDHLSQLTSNYSDVFLWRSKNASSGTEAADNTASIIFSSCYVSTKGFQLG
jgi:hypothetical protein